MSGFARRINTKQMNAAANNPSPTNIIPHMRRRNDRTSRQENTRTAALRRATTAATNQALRTEFCAKPKLAKIHSSQPLSNQPSVLANINPRSRRPRKSIKAKGHAIQPSRETTSHHQPTANQ